MLGGSGPWASKFSLITWLKDAYYHLLDIGAEERSVRVILYDPDLFWSVRKYRPHIRWNSQARGVINIWTGTISASTFAQCLQVGATRLPPGRFPRRICGALDELITPETDSHLASVCLSDDEDLVGWLDQTRDHTLLRILVIFFRKPYDGLRPEGRSIMTAQIHHFCLAILHILPKMHSWE